VSKATKRHCAGTVQSQGGRVRSVKQVGFKPGPEDSYRRRGRLTSSGRLFQTRAAATGKTRSPTVESRVRLTISDEEKNIIADDRRLLRALKLPTRLKLRFWRCYIKVQCVVKDT